MRALVFAGPDDAGVEELPAPTPAAGEVLIRSHTVGICHSDFELLSGAYIIPFRYPIIPGHEWAGEVVGLGAGTEGFRVGDRVVGECVVGPGGRDHFGFSIPGAAAELFTARGEWLHVLPDELGFTEGALVEPFSVAYNAVRSARVDPSDRVAVIGGGPIGLLCVVAAAASGADVTLIEPRGDRRLQATAFGAAATIDPSAAPLGEQTAERTGGAGFDVVIEAAGHPGAMASALGVAGVGGRVVMVGIDTGKTTEVALGLIQSKALLVTGIIGSVGIWPAAIRFLARGLVDPTPLVTARYPLARATEALAGATTGAGNIKVHLEIGS